jgi:hypothetical protein
LKFEYFDGTDWYDTWGNVDPKKNRQNSARQQSNLTGLPEAVRITLLMDSNPKKRNPDSATSEQQPAPPFVFRTVVRLNLAGAVQDAANTSTTTTPDANSSPDQNQAPANGGNN